LKRYKTIQVIFLLEIALGLGRLFVLQMHILLTADQILFIKLQCCT